MEAIKRGTTGCWFVACRALSTPCPGTACGAALRDVSIFAKEWVDVTGRHDTLGAPLAVFTIWREFDRLIKAAGVKRIKIHGLRHTCATLMLAVGVPPHVVQRRLGHSKVEDDARGLRARSTGDAAERGGQAGSAAPRVSC